MEKQLSAIGYWLSLVSTVLALNFRFLTAIGRVRLSLGLAGGSAISYKQGPGLMRFRYATWLTASLAVAMSSSAWLATAEPAQAQETAPQVPPHPTSTQNAPIQSPPLPGAAELETWRRAILKVPTPKAGCFTAKYPDAGWTEVPCKTPPHILFRPRRSGVVRSGQEVGGQSKQDFMPSVTGEITEAEGSFDSVSNVTSECQVQCPNGNCPAAPACISSDPTNSFSLQLNTSFLLFTEACKSTQDPLCSGWEQFLYTQPGNCSGCTGDTYIQYWLLNYAQNGSCPAPTASAAECGGGVLSGKWCSYPPDCVINSLGSAAPPTIPISSLGLLKLTGDAASGSLPTDSVTLWEDGTAYKTTGGNYLPDLNTMWKESEFNVFGNGNDSQAVFNKNAKIQVRTGVTSGTTRGPGCNVDSTTAESNNLTLGTNRPAAVQGNMPALVFSETNASPSSAPPSCAAAESIGDTHINTFDGLYYDFQASGDFVLLQSQNFTVQTRQAPGPPHYPDTAVNKAVATQMGKTRVEVYLSPRQLLIDGKATNLANGKSVLLSTGVQVTRHGNEYDITSESGDFVHATLDTDRNNPWIDVTVGLGKTPASDAHGLLGNPEGNAQELETATGGVLKEPVAFSELYNTYGESWRVPSGKSLFSKATTIKSANPTKPLSASDLDPAAAAHAIAACKAAGITSKDLLDSCTLDTTVLNNDSAAKVFTTARLPIHVIRPMTLKVPVAPQ